MRKVCTGCKKNKDYEEYSPNKSHSTGKQSMCRKCIQRKYGKIPAHKAKKYQEKYKSNPESAFKVSARMRLNHQIAKGKVKRPEKCQVCKKKKRVQGHHTDYNKPLDVVWLCIRCHAEEELKKKMLLSITNY